MGRPVYTSVSLNTAVATGYALAQARGSAGALTLNGSLVTAGVGLPNAARRVNVHSVGNDSGITFTITGLSRTENGPVTISETIAGANAGDSYTTQDFASVTSIVASGAAAANVSAGTNGVGSGPWIAVDLNVRSRVVPTFAAFIIAGTPTYQIDVTYDDIFGLMLPSNVPFPRAIAWVPSIGQTINYQGSISDQSVRAVRQTITALGGSPDTVQLVFNQSGD